MSRVNTLRGQKWVNFPLEVAIHLLFLCIVQLLVAAKTDPFFFKKFPQLCFNNSLFNKDILGNRIAGIDLFLRKHAVDGGLFYPSTNLLLKATDSFHKEFIKI